MTKLFNTFAAVIATLTVAVVISASAAPASAYYCDNGYGYSSYNNYDSHYSYNSYNSYNSYHSSGYGY